MQEMGSRAAMGHSRPISSAGDSVARQPAAARRLGLKMSPPTIFVEFEDPGNEGLLMHHKVQLTAKALQQVRQQRGGVRAKGETGERKRRHGEQGLLQSDGRAWQPAASSGGWVGL